MSSSSATASRSSKDERLFISKTFGGETVGLEEIDDSIWSLYYVLLARFDERHMKFYG